MAAMWMRAVAVESIQKFAIVTRSNLFHRTLPPLSRGMSGSTPPEIPAYKIRRNENVTEKKSRLLYQSRKRGMLENCLLLSTFAGKFLNGFNDDQLKMYDKLINLPSNDWDIYYWATGANPVPEEFDNDIMKLLQEHAKNSNKEKRYDAPPLY